MVDVDPASGALLSAGRSRRPGAARAGRSGAVGDEPAVSSADGLRGRDDDHRPFRAGARPGRAVVVAARIRQQAGGYRAVRAAAADLSARAARPKRLLQPGQEGAAVRLLSGRASRTPVNTPGTLVFTCLSHDIIAHETTHALLDGVHPRFNEAVNRGRAGVPRGLRRHRRAVPALFAIRACCATRSRARAAISPAKTCSASWRSSSAGPPGRGSALRDALGAIDPVTGKWTAAQAGSARARDAPSSRTIAARFSSPRCSARSSRSIARAPRICIASPAKAPACCPRATSIPTSPARLADEAARVRRSYVLQMCIRAIDYCPPVGITFGDYLRGIVTADYDLNPEDDLRLPAGVRRELPAVGHQSAKACGACRSKGCCGRRRRGDEEARRHDDAARTTCDKSVRRRRYGSSMRASDCDEPRRQARQASHVSSRGTSRAIATDLEGVDDNAAALWGWLVRAEGRKLARASASCSTTTSPPTTVFRSQTAGSRSRSRFIRCARALRRRPRRARRLTDLVVEITQRRRGYFDPDGAEARRTRIPAATESRSRRFPLPRRLHAADRSGRR